MERALSQDERIRRAEEIYARRQNIRERTRHATVNLSEPKNFKLLRRVVLQAIICLLLYLVFYLINTTNYSFSSVTLDKTEEILTQDADFTSIYNNISGKINNYISSLNIITENNNEETKTEENTEIINSEGENIIEETNAEEVQIESAEENNTEENQSENQEKSNEDNVGVVENSENASEKLALNNIEETSQEEIQNQPISETDRIKQTYSFILPLKRKSIIRIWRKRAIISNSLKIS